MQLSKEEYARKRIHNGCLVQIESLAMLNSYSRDRVFNPQLTAIKKKMCNVQTFVTHECEILFVHTYFKYENVLWLNLCYTQEYDI